MARVPPQPIQHDREVCRIRISFQRGEEVKYISHLDLMRAWVRIFRRAELPIAYSQGFSPHPQLSFASPLPVGVVGEEELFDITFLGEIHPDQLLAAVTRQLPTGLVIREAWPIAVSAPPLTRSIIGAEFTVTVESNLSRESIEAAVSRFLASDSVPWERTRDGKTRRYDLRPLVEELAIGSVSQGRAELTMRLVADNSRAGRPEEVVEALEIGEPYPHIRRRRLLFREPIR